MSSKIKIWRMLPAVEQLQAKAKCIVQHPAFEETGEG